MSCVCHCLLLTKLCMCGVRQLDINSEMYCINTSEHFADMHKCIVRMRVGSFFFIRNFADDGIMKYACS